MRRGQADLEGLSVSGNGQRLRGLLDEGGQESLWVEVGDVEGRLSRAFPTATARRGDSGKVRRREAEVDLGGRCAAEGLVGSVVGVMEQAELDSAAQISECQGLDRSQGEVVLEGFPEALEATLMLEGGADIRFIQQMLGHANLAATEIYTQVSIGKLKQVHSATPPGARLGGPPGEEKEEVSSSS